MAAFDMLFTRPVHFFCLYHLYTNLKGLFKGGWSNEFRKKMVGLLKQCAYAPTKAIFNKCLDDFIESGQGLAKKFLEDLPFDKWAVSHSPDFFWYGEMTSNVAESLNNWIKDIRGLPVIFMLDIIRRNIMAKFVERREESSKWTGALCKRK